VIRRERRYGIQYQIRGYFLDPSHGCIVSDDNHCNISWRDTVDHFLLTMVTIDVILIFVGFRTEYVFEFDRLVVNMPFQVSEPSAYYDSVKRVVSPERSVIPTVSREIRLAYTTVSMDT